MRAELFLHLRKIPRGNQDSRWSQMPSARPSRSGEGARFRPARFASASQSHEVPPRCMHLHSLHLHLPACTCLHAGNSQQEIKLGDKEPSEASVVLTVADSECLLPTRHQFIAWQMFHYRMTEKKAKLGSDVRSPGPAGPKWKKSAIFFCC